MEISPETLTCFRYLLFCPTLFLIMRFQKETCFLPPRDCLLPLFFMGLCGITVNNIAQFTGLKYSTVTNATLISSTTPTITALLATIFLRERLNYLQWCGIFLSLGGTIFLISQGNLEVIAHISFNIGDLLFFSSQVAWAVYSLISLRVMRKMSILATTAWAGVFGALLTFLYGCAADVLTIKPVSLTVIFSMMYIIWGGGVFAMLLWNFGIKRVGASQTAIFLNIMPLVGILSGVALLNEQLQAQEILGAAAILLGVYTTTQSQTLLRRFHRHGSIEKTRG